MAQEMRNSVAGFTLPESVRAMEAGNDDVLVPRFAAVNEAVDAGDDSSESFDDLSDDFIAADDAEDDYASEEDVDSTAEAAEESVFDMDDDAELAEIAASAGELDGQDAGSTKADFSVDLDESEVTDDFAFELDVEQGETDGEQDVSSDSDDKRNISAA